MNNVITQNIENKFKVVDIANYFITLSLKENIEIDIHLLKNLLYMASGWFLTFSQEPLLNENFKANKDGICLLSLDKHYKRKIKYKIQVEILEENFYIGSVPYPISSKVTNLLNKVWELYKNYELKDFEFYTKSELSPFGIIKNMNTKELFNTNDKYITISNELIKQQFNSFY